MRIKAFTAMTVQDAMSQVKNELGAEAVILHTRKVKKGGFLGFFAKEVVEIMAAIEDVQEVAKSKTAGNESREQIKKKKIVLQNEKTDNNIHIPNQTSVNAYKAQESLKNIKLDEKTLEKSEENTKSQQVIDDNLQNNFNKESLFDILVENDVNPKVATSIVNAIQKYDAEGKDYLPLLADYFSKKFGPTIQIKEGTEKTKIVALIGATGVGKTTTIAKIAASFVLEKGCSVALITADTYRISAVEQLKTYSDIIGVPLEIVYSALELQTAITKHMDKQLVLIDTAGRSQYNSEQLDELRSLLTASEDIEKHLVLSSTTKYKDAVDIIKQFSQCSPDRVLFTKVDETSGIGTVISVLHEFPMHLSYLTTGQSVPDDIIIADPHKLAELVLKE